MCAGNDVRDADIHGDVPGSLRQTSTSAPDHVHTGARRKVDKKQTYMKTETCKL